MPFYDRQPYIQPLHQLLTEVMSGEIRIPRFQRPGTQTTWTPTQRGDLLDSLYRGFPIGTVLLWSSTSTIRTLDVVGTYRVPDAKSESLRLLLDGHQRLSTLVQILGEGLLVDMERSGVLLLKATEDVQHEEAWYFDLDVPMTGMSSRERFVLLKFNQIPSQSQIPLGIVLNRIELNRWIRSRPHLTDNQVKDLDDLRDRLREYNVPVAVLAADNLKEATESFKRINSSGTPMSDFHMIAALAYQNDFDPQELFEEARSEFLVPIGWNDIADSDVLRVCSALVGQNPSRMEIDNLASFLRKETNLIAKAFGTIARTAGFFRKIGIHGPEALPYSWHLITASIVLAEYDGSATEVSILEALDKWFWTTTYGEVFANVNGGIYNRARSALRSLIDGGDVSQMEKHINKKVRPVNRFDFRAVRAKACALAMARSQDKNNLDGPAHRALAIGASSMQLLTTAGNRSTWWYLGIVNGHSQIPQIRDAIKRMGQGIPTFDDTGLLETFGFPCDNSMDVKGLFNARRNALLSEEKTFVINLGFDWDEDVRLDDSLDLF